MVVDFIIKEVLRSHSYEDHDNPEEKYEEDHEYILNCDSSKFVEVAGISFLVAAMFRSRRAWIL